MTKLMSILSTAVMLSSVISLPVSPKLNAEQHKYFYIPQTVSSQKIDEIIPKKATCDECGIGEIIIIRDEKVFDKDYHSRDEACKHCNFGVDEIWIATYERIYRCSNCNHLYSEWIEKEYIKCNGYN